MHLALSYPSRLLAAAILLTAGAQTCLSLEAYKTKRTGTYQDSFDRVYPVWVIHIGTGFDPSKIYSFTINSDRLGIPGGTPFAGDLFVHNPAVTFGVRYGVLVDGGSTPITTIVQDYLPILSAQGGTDIVRYLIDTGLRDGTGKIVGSVSSSPASVAFIGRYVPPPLPDPTTSKYLNIEVTINYDPPDDCECKNGGCSRKTSESLSSVDVKIGLGKNDYGGRSDSLHLSQELPSSFLAQPSTLAATVGTNSEIILTNGVLRQVRTPKVLADVVATNASKYDVRIYYTNDVAASMDTNGFWVPTGSPYKTITFENPDGTASSNRLYVTESEAGVTNISKYTWDNTNLWTFEARGNLKIETLTRTWDTNNTVRTELHSIYSATSNLVFQEQKKFSVLPWGEKLTEQVIDPSGARLTNTWEYQTNSSIGGYTRLKQTTTPSGYWERYEYDSSNRETNRVFAYLNATNGAPADQARQIVTSYSDSNPRVTVVEKALGVEIGRSYQNWFTDEIQYIQCQTTGAVSTASENLISITKRYDSSDPFSGHLKSVRQQNGVTTLYSYSTNNNQKSTSISVGLTNSSGTAVQEGTVTTTVVALTGETLSSASTNITGGSLGIRLSSESYGYDSGDYFKGSPRIKHLDGTTNEVNYGCCHPDSTVDPDGTYTYFSFDQLDRQTATTRSSVTSSNVFDAAGNIIKNIRIGSDSSTITLSQAVYDTAHRRTAETNALNGGTTISEAYDSDGQLNRTNTYPDGTRVEIYYRDGSLKQISGSATHPVRYEYGVAAENGTNRVYRKEIKLNSDGTDTAEFKTDYFDMVGRAYKTIYADSSSSRSEFNNWAQLTKDVDPDGVTTLYQYNSKGELEISAVDLNQGGIVDLTSDRITRTIRDVANVSSVDVNRTTTYAFFTNGSALSNVVAESRISTDGRQSWDIRFGLTSQSSIFYPGNQYQIITNTAPDTSYTVTTNYQGRIVSVTRRDSAGSQIGETRYGYDAHGRQSTVTDARNGATTYTFNNADQVLTATTPSPGNGQSPQTTSYSYDSQGRLTATSLPDGGSTSNDYYPSGELGKTSGTRTYPVAYSYDSQGRMKTMTNWSTFATLAGSRVTTWNYDTNRGFLSNKSYPDNQGPSYTYSAAGRLATRLWARGITTRYTNNAAGDLVGIGYSDSTASVVYNVDRLGRRTNIVDAAGSRFLTLHESGLILTETNSSGLLAGLNVTNGFDTYLRRTTLAFRTNGSLQFTHSYSFDGASRMTNVSDGTYSAGYTYLANSPLIRQIAFQNAGTTKMTTSKTYDFLNRLSQISSTPSASGQSPFTFNYWHNDANQRIHVTLADGSYWAYTYDSLGQVTSGKRYWSDGTPVAGQQFEYTFDDIGNRTATKAGGDSSGGSLRSATYGANSLNQYTNRTVPTGFDILGISHAQSTVTVNSAGTYRKGEYFQKAPTVDNSTGAVYQAVTVQATYSGSTNTSTGNVFIAKSPEIFTYDADGNLTSDGHWTNRWDAENRLIAMEPLSNTPSAAKQSLKFTYDSQWRRISKTVSNWTGSAWALSYDNRFTYDDGNLISEINSTNNAIICSYMWRAEASKEPAGAGNLAVIAAVASGTHFPVYNGNGDVMGLASSAGSTSANYEYGPCGEAIRTSGVVAPLNQLHFSTKYTDNETDLLYYGFRFDHPKSGVWLSRDPIEESGGPNLYSFVENQSVGAVDRFGLRAYKAGSDDPKINGDTGAGSWNSEPFSMAMIATKELILSRLPAVWLAMPDAVSHLRHYFANSGTDRTIRLQKMIDDVPSAKRVYETELDQAKTYIEKLPKGTHQITSAAASPGYNSKGENGNWFYAVGGYSAWGKGTATVCENGEYLLQFEYKFYDRYNWDKGKKVTIGGVTITDDFMGKFHRMGLAREFDMRGSVKKTIRWKKGQSDASSENWESGAGR
jgi:RHS repeat-associated protein